MNVTGGGFGDGLVEVRWNGWRGALLATATGPDFSVPITVPEDAVNGTYVINAQGMSGGASVAFKVVSAGSAADNTEATQRSSSQGTTAGSSASGVAPPATQPAGAASAGSAPAPSGSSSAAFPSPIPAQEAAAAGGGAAGVSPPASPSSEATHAGGVTAPSGRVADTARRAGPVAAGAAAAAPSERTAATQNNLVPMEATATGDAWSGFESGSIPAGASLTDSGPATNRDLPLRAVSALFVLGLLSLLAGFGVAEVRRARVVGR